ncbi:WD40/YVTN/BNR-like repeat-containing protein [Pseudomonas abieticivorans]|uniref:WD40/YVTN/BNR-like repeat-containing protein n=1 Tax=Pseudomonas abieticivorans TaxID=2931382 RepID=UPI003F691344
MLSNALPLLGVLAVLGMPPAVQADQAVPTVARATASLMIDAVNTGARLVVVGDHGRILYSDDQGHAWRQAQVPSQQLLTAVYFADALHGWAVGHDAQVLATVDGGLTWTLQYQDPQRQSPLLGVWFKDARQGLAVGAYGLLLATADGGQHWQDVSARVDNPDQLHFNAITALGDAQVFIVGEQGSLFRSVDQGEHWQRLSVPYNGSLFGVVATGQPHTLLAYGLRGHLLRSSDSGDSWQTLTLAGERGPLEFGLAKATLLDNGALVIVGNGGTVLRSDDHGLTFNRVSRADRQALAGVASVGSDRLILAGQGGVRLACGNGSEVTQP